VWRKKKRKKKPVCLPLPHHRPLLSKEERYGKGKRESTTLTIVGTIKRKKKKPNFTKTMGEKRKVGFSPKERGINGNCPIM